MPSRLRKTPVEAGTRHVGSQTIYTPRQQHGESTKGNPNPDKNTEIDASRTAAGAFTATVPGACEDVMHASTFVSL